MSDNSAEQVFPNLANKTDEMLSTFVASKLFGLCREPNSICLIAVGVDDVDIDVDRHKDKKDLSFVFLLGLMEDPVFQFWKMVKTDTLKGGCLVMFAPVIPCPGWADLTRVYGGTMFGKAYFMTYKEKAVTNIVPSMKGLFS